MNQNPNTPAREVLHDSGPGEVSPDTDGDDPATLASDVAQTRERGAATHSDDGEVVRSGQFDGEPEPVHVRLRRDEQRE